jgi:hypothetical protein
MQQCKNNWSTVSEKLLQKEQFKFDPAENPLNIKLSIVGILLSNICQEKAIAFDGAAVFHTLLKTNCSS